MFIGLFLRKEKGFRASWETELNKARQAPLLWTPLGALEPFSWKCCHMDHTLANVAPISQLIKLVATLGYYF